MSVEQDLRMLLRPDQPHSLFIEDITGFNPNLRCRGLIAEGGEGRVYLIEELAQVSAYPKFFARKVFRRDEVAPDNEIRNIIKLSSSRPHPNLIRVFRHGFLTSWRRAPPDNVIPRYYIDMELGRSNLGNYIRDRFWGSTPQNVPSTSEVWNILSQLASAVQYMHNRGVVHRDIKPDNFITSWSDPNLWKLGDFGISVISSGDLMSTQIYGKGSNEYVAPEVHGGRLYGTKVDIWGIGCVLYELFAGHRLFKDRCEIEGYETGKMSLPQLYFPYPAGIMGPGTAFNSRPVASQFAFRVLARSKGSWGGIARNQLEHFWKAFRDMVGTDKSRTGEVCGDVLGRMREVNELLKWMLDCDPAKRPSIDVVVHHFRGFYLRSMLENDEIFRNGVVESLINPTRKVGGIFNKDVLARWQFVIKLEAICAGKNRLQFYRELNLIAKRFITKDVDDPDLNRELLELLSQKFELCDEFKRIYVHGLGTTDRDRQAIIQELTFTSHAPALNHPCLLGQPQGPHRKVVSTGSIPPYLLASVPLQRNLSEQSNDSSCFRMRKMSLDDINHENEAPQHDHLKQSGQSVEDDGEEQDEESVDGDQVGQSLCTSGLNSLPHSLYQSQPGSGQQSLQHSLHGSFTGNPFGDEAEWVCLDPSTVPLEIHQNDAMDIGGVGNGENGI